MKRPGPRRDRSGIERRSLPSRTHAGLVKPSLVESERGPADQERGRVGGHRLVLELERDRVRGGVRPPPRRSAAGSFWVEANRAAPAATIVVGSIWWRASRPSCCLDDSRQSRSAGLARRPGRSPSAPSPSGGCGQQCLAKLRRSRDDRRDQRFQQLAIDRSAEADRFAVGPAGQSGTSKLT